MKNLKRSTLREIQEKYVAGEFDRRDEQRVRRVVWVKNTTGSAIPARSAIQLNGWTSRDVFIGVAPSNPIKTAITLDRIPAGKVGRAKIDLFFANLTNATGAMYATAALVGQTTSDGTAFEVVALDGNFAALVRFQPSGGSGGGTAQRVVASISKSDSDFLTNVTGTVPSYTESFENKTVLTGATLSLSDTASTGAIAVVVAVECADGSITTTTKYLSLTTTDATIGSHTGTTNGTANVSFTKTTGSASKITSITYADVVKYE